MSDRVFNTGRDRLVGSRVALRAFLSALALSALLGVLVILDVVDDERFLLSGGMLAATCLATLIAAIVADHGRFQRWMHAAMWTAWAAGALWVGLIWNVRAIGNELTEAWARIAGVPSVAVAWSVIGAVTLAPRTCGGAVRTVRWTTFATLTAWAAFGEFSIVSPALAEQVVELVGSRTFTRVFAASIVLGAAGTVAQPVLIRLARAREGEGAIRGRHARVALGCPRCGAPCEVEANVDAACPACRLEIRVELAEPRCACGYLLHGISAATCPECGAAVPERLRWRPPVSPAPSP